MTRVRGEPDRVLPGDPVLRFQSLPSLVELAGRAISDHLARQRESRPASAPLRALDGTAGQGFDTLRLARDVGRGGRVEAFDVQPEALAIVADKLSAAGLRERVTLHACGHERLAELELGPFDAAMFNFGWLPGFDHAVRTRAATSRAALEATLERLRPGALLSIVAYPAHEGGDEELAVIEELVAGLSKRRWLVHVTRVVNRRGAPVLVLVERAGEDGEA